MSGGSKYRLAGPKLGRKRVIWRICDFPRRSGCGKCETRHIPREPGRYHGAGALGQVSEIGLLRCCRIR